VLTLFDSSVASVDADSTRGMTFYENRRGEQKAVLPEFAGLSVPVDAPSRRAELARILAAEDGHHVARAMVNRTWAMFFGYGFTNPIDDLGPHNPPSNPELLETLTVAFAGSGYDLQRLMRWIALSDAFSLSSLPPTPRILSSMIPKKEACRSFLTSIPARWARNRSTNLFARPFIPFPAGRLKALSGVTIVVSGLNSSCGHTVPTTTQNHSSSKATLLRRCC
jgi:hypothetical protein